MEEKFIKGNDNGNDKIVNSKSSNRKLAWLLASRPKTLSGAAVPVVMALAMAWADSGRLHVVPALLCLMFAFVMQIDANFVNDYFDFLKGTDRADRLGPQRACAQGWIAPSAMRRGIALTTVCACLVGLPLIYYGGWWLIAVGAACVVFCFLYTTHLSYRGLGDVLVLLFFGLVPLCLTYYLQTGTLTRNVVYVSLACGMVIDTLLVVNNHRDREGDRRAGKLTLAVLMGPRPTELFYFALGLMACHMGLPYFFTHQWFTFFLPFVYLAIHARTYRSMKRIGSGRQLNAILGQTARNIALYGLFFSIGRLLDAWVLL